MKCARCGGALRSTTLEHYERWPRETGLIVFENVPARECVECGEVYFDAATSLRMEQMIEAKEEPRGQITVPVYTFQPAV